MRIKHSAVVLVFNDKDELALQLRAAHDDAYPMHWDFSAAGGMEPGEDHHTAAARELREEIGISGELTFVHTLVYQEPEYSEYLNIYKTHHTGPFTLDPNEVADLQFYSLSKIDEMIAQGEPFHPEFIWWWQRKQI